MALGAAGVANLDLMGTAAYLRILAEDFHNELAADAWVAIAEAVADHLDRGVEGDPVMFRG